MPKYNIRFVQMIPVWAYAEIEADTIDDALDLLEEDSEHFIYDLDMEDPAPGFPESDFVFIEVQNENGDWESI